MTYKVNAKMSHIANLSLGLTLGLSKIYAGALTWRLKE